MRTNKKGFTLIELLAVIVILAIIALIATPIVMNLITKARKSAAQDSAYGIIKAAETYYAESLLDNQGDGFTEMTFACGEVSGSNKCMSGEVELTFNGTKPSAGNVIISQSGNVTFGDADAELTINGYGCKKTANGTVTCE